MNALTTLPPGGIPAVFQSAGPLPNMAAAASANLTASFAVISIKGKNWRIKYRGETELITDDRDLPMQLLPVVIVGISEDISKIWYEKGWTEESAEAPDCFSTNGRTPDPAAAKKQNATCAACPKNQFGSRITDNGKRGKACQDARRIAVVPRGDMENEVFGGPMLLRLPAMSLPNLDAYCKMLTRFNAQPFMVETTLRFNYDVSHPEVMFETGGWLNNDEATHALELIKDPRVDHILSTEVSAVQADAEQGDGGALAQGGPAPAFQAGAAQAGATQTAAAQPDPAAVAAAAKARADAATAAAKAAAAQAAAAQAQAEAQAQAQAAAAAPAGTPARKAGGFGKKSQAAASQPAQQAAAPADPAAAVPSATTTTVVQQAPSDMEAAIDDLLN